MGTSSKCTSQNTTFTFFFAGSCTTSCLHRLSWYKSSKVYRSILEITQKSGTIVLQLTQQPTQHHNLCRLPCISALKLQVYLHGKAFPTACVSTAEGSLPLMVSLYVTVQVEAVGELFVAPFLGAQKLSPLIKMDAQLVLVHEPGVIKQLFTPLARHLGCRDKLAHLKNPD